MDLELQLLEGKFKNEMLLHLESDIFQSERKIKKTTKLCRKIVNGEIASEDKLVKHLHTIEHLLLDDSKQSLKLLQIILLIGKEEYNGVNNVLDFFTDEHDIFALKPQLEYLRSFLRIYEEKDYKFLVEDMKVILNYLIETPEFGNALWKLAYDVEDKQQLEPILDFAKVIYPDDENIFEFQIWLLQKEEKHEDVVQLLENFFAGNDIGKYEPDFVSRLNMVYCHSLFAVEKYNKVVSLVADSLEILPESFDAVLHKSEFLVVRQQALNKLSERNDFELEKWKDLIEEDFTFLQNILPDDERFISIQENSPIKN